MSKVSPTVNTKHGEEGASEESSRPSVVSRLKDSSASSEHSTSINSRERSSSAEANLFALLNRRDGAAVRALQPNSVASVLPTVGRPRKGVGTERTAAPTPRKVVYESDIDLLMEHWNPQRDTFMSEVPPRYEEHDIHGVSYNDVHSRNIFVHEDCYATVGKPVHSDGPHHAEAVSHNQLPHTEEELLLDVPIKPWDWRQVCTVNYDRVPCSRHNPDRHYRQKGIQFCRLDRVRHLNGHASVTNA